MGIRPEIVQESRHNATGLHGRRHGVSAPALVNCRAMRATLDPIRLNGGTILSDEVYARIGAAILDGTLPAGARLRDVELAEQLGVSRTPVREALQRLERFGLVEVAVGRYTRVSEPSDRLREETGEFTAYFMGNALRIALQRCSGAATISSPRSSKRRMPWSQPPGAKTGCRCSRHPRRCSSR